MKIFFIRNGEGDALNYIVAESIKKAIDIWYEHNLSDPAEVREISAEYQNSFVIVQETK